MSFEQFLLKTHKNTLKSTVLNILKTDLHNTEKFKLFCKKM